jgi:hypothetical protein
MDTKQARNLSYRLSVLLDRLARAVRPVGRDRLHDESALSYTVDRNGDVTDEDGDE